MHDKKILIVDDKHMTLAPLAKELSREEYVVTCVVNGKEAITRLRNDHYDLVITDLIMPELNGIGLLREIKKTAPETSVMIFTGYGDRNSVIDALRLGADDYLLKPCDINELLFRVSHCLENRDLLRQLTEQNSSLKKEIAERLRLEEKLREHAEKIKIFSYSIAHDIKAPAISLYGLVKLFIKKFDALLPAKGHSYCKQILHSSQQIVTLVDQLNLYMSAKEMPLNLERIQLQQLVESTREEFALQLDTRRITWVVKPKELPLILADKMAILRVMRNCVDNALKYGGEELHEIAINYKQSPEFHILSVENDGTGLTPHECKRVFELFRREKSSQGIKGTGLGLAIVKEIIERHKGEVWAEPGEKKGITFHMSIAKELSEESYVTI